MSLPQPNPLALLHSEQLIALIRDEIVGSGPIPFSRFMQRALYEPGLGYYMSGLSKFGAAGDFVTAPEISPLFSQCLAMQCMDIMQNIPNAQIIEFGAGTGAMAAELLSILQKRNCLPECYYIVELSAELKQRQKKTLQQNIPELLPRITWLNSLNKLNINGIVLVNEVLDAMPVESFIKRDTGMYCINVAWDELALSFCLVETKASELLAQAVVGLEKNLQVELPNNYCSEINLLLNPWFNSVSDCLARGVALIIDYGYPQAEYYFPERSMGTLMCHYQHRVHRDPLLWPGLQDITAHVDFTAVAEAADLAGLNVLAFSDQARFLLGCGMEGLLADAMQSVDLPTQLTVAQQAKTLMLPGEMGEQFKVMAVAKQYNHPLLGFNEMNDQRHRL